MSTSVEAFSKGVDAAVKNPIMFVPSLAPIVVGLIFTFLAYVIFPTVYGIPGLFYVTAPNWALLWVGMFISSILGFLAFCMVVDMANDFIKQQPINLSKSLSVVTSRIGDLIIAAIISGVCAITIILIPVAFFIVTIAIIEGASAIESTKKSFNFVVKNIGEVIVFIVIVIVVYLICAFIPYIGSILQWIFGVVVTTSSVYFYLTRRPVTPPTPPAPPVTEIPPTPPAPPIPPTEEKKFCTFCGAEMVKEALYCPKCGKKQEA